MVEEVSEDYWNNWKLDPDEFNRIIDKNSNALSAIYGYVAEERLREAFLEDDDRVTGLRSPEDQNSADKGDWAFNWRGQPMKIEVKSLQTHTIKSIDSNQSKLTEDGNEQIQYEAGFHLKGTSDQRTITHNGEQYNTTLMDLENTDVDIMAVNLYKIKDEWDFAFLKVEDLPRSKGSNYPESLRQKLARSQIKLTIPLQQPFTKDLYELMDDIIKKDKDS